MGQCLRGKMAEVGLIPPMPAPAVAEVETPAAETAASVEEAVPAEPALDVTPPAPVESEPEVAADVDQLVAATFGLLRAEPDGSVVIAGSGKPGSKVQVFANGELLGSVEVEASGDWVFVPEAPLPPGGLEITLGEEGVDGTAEDSFIVVINEDKTSQPLVVASKPGEASEVLQGLTAPTAMAAASEPATPAASAAETPAVAPEAASTEMAAASEEEPVATEPSAMMAAVEPEETPSTEPVEEPAMLVAAAPEPVAPAPAAATPVAPSPAPAAETPAASAPEPAAVVEAPEAPVAAAPAEASVTTAEPADAAATEEPAPALAAVPSVEPSPASSVQLADVPPSIDAIEIETDRTFFAGAGPDGGIVRLYVDDAFIADAIIEGGRWLIEAGPVLDKPTQRVRVDLLPPDSANVVARAEVDFVVDVPAVEEPVAIAEAPAAAPEAAPAEAAAPAPAAEPAEPAPTPEPVPSATADAAPATEPTAAEPAVAAQAEPAPEPSPAPEPAAVAEAPAEPAPAEPAVPTMVAVSLGDPETQRFVSGKAIIRRGDNLWTIARRVYGEGLKYTTIYQANTGQIRDPDRIYPGQVFDLPEGLAAQ